MIGDSKAGNKMGKFPPNFLCLFYETEFFNYKNLALDNSKSCSFAHTPVIGKIFYIFFEILVDIIVRPSFLKINYSKLVIGIPLNFVECFFLLTSN